jgi:hypothetical protein
VTAEGRSRHRVILPPASLRSLLLTALLPAALTAGCGYTLGLPPSTTAGAATSRTIAVPLLENDTTEPLLGEIVSHRLKSQLNATAPWRIVNTDDRPEWLLKGRVTGVLVTPMAFDADSQATEYRVELHVNLTLTRTADGSVFWSAPNLISVADYYANLDVAATRRSKDLSFHDASQRLADLVAEQLTVALLESKSPQENPQENPQ